MLHAPEHMNAWIVHQAEAGVDDGGSEAVFVVRWRREGRGQYVREHFDVSEGEPLVGAEAEERVVHGSVDADEDPATVVGAEVARGACIGRERGAEGVGGAAGEGAREGRPVGARDEDRWERPRPRPRLLRLDGNAPVAADSGHAAPVDEARETLEDEAEHVGVEVAPWRVHWRGGGAACRWRGEEEEWNRWIPLLLEAGGDVLGLEGGWGTGPHL